MKGEKFYIATAIAYSSKQPHIGNDYEIVYADAIARHKRLCCRDVFFLTGTDEHGQKIEEIAAAANISPKESADKITEMIKNTYARLNISYDKFIRTTDGEHIESVKKIFARLYENGDIYKDQYEGPYCVPCESFFTPSQISASFGLCPDCGGELREVKEVAYKLKLSKYQQKLERYIESHPDFIVPVQRKREMENNFIKPGVQELCVSRSNVKWGVPVEFDPGYTVYVWIDALSNYITALGYNPDNEKQPELFEKYWPCDLHVIGKDIMRFHSIYWPVMLWGLGIEPPAQIIGHPWWLFNDEKMSKSTGNVVYTDHMIDKFGADAVRYYLLCEMPYDRDTSFSHMGFVRRYNADLVNTLSNLVNRTVVMAEKYFGGIVPEPCRPGEFDGELKEAAIAGAGNYAALMNEYKIAEAIGEILTILYRANKYIDETEPWVLAKDEAKKERLGTVLYNLLESVRIAGVLLSPIMPETSARIFSQIDADAKIETSYESAFVFGGLKPGSKLNKAEPIFMRLDEKKILAELTVSDKPR